MQPRFGMDQPGQLRGEASMTRIGITVTTKIDKRAARRNRLKRRIRELFRTQRQKLVAEVDIVIVALNGAAGLSFEDVSREILFLFRKARLYRRKFA